MGRKQVRRASWFKMFVSLRPVIDSAPDDVAGRALKAALGYFDTGNEPTGLDPFTNTLFSAIRPSVDDAVADYKKAAEKNRANVNKRWGKKCIPSDTTGNHSLPMDTEDRGIYPSKGDISPNIQAIHNISSSARLDGRPPADEIYDRSWMQEGGGGS